MSPLPLPEVPPPATPDIHAPHPGVGAAREPHRGRTDPPATVRLWARRPRRGSRRGRHRHRPDDHHNRHRAQRPGPCSPTARSRRRVRAGRIGTGSWSSPARVGCCPAFGVRVRTRTPAPTDAAASVANPTGSRPRPSGPGADGATLITAGRSSTPRTRSRAPTGRSLWSLLAPPPYSRTVATIGVRDVLPGPTP